MRRRSTKAPAARKSILATALRGLFLFSTTLREIAADLRPFRSAGPEGLYKLRVGHYRVIYALDSQRVLVIRVAHRREVNR
ncbi:MAG TPA: type II toxin-antitoxin system RelE/ParE family toxin [Thermoanaerobaculia bacterium]|nr:type II toxin-antitoxin system RelE/ParE family toxin [Thermoanaerobaculia bacterium]